MRSERWLDYHLAVDLAFEEQELGVRGEALRSVHWLVLDLEYLIADDERLGTVAPLDDLGVALDLINELTVKSIFWKTCIICVCVNSPLVLLPVARARPTLQAFSSLTLQKCYLAPFCSPVYRNPLHSAI